VLAVTDIMPFACCGKIDGLPVGGGGIPLRCHKSVVIDAAMGTGRSKIVSRLLHDGVLRDVDPGHRILLVLSTSTIDRTRRGTMPLVFLRGKAEIPQAHEALEEEDSVIRRVAHPSEHF
jgi:hypothetical protein